MKLARKKGVEWPRGFSISKDRPPSGGGKPLS